MCNARNCFLFKVCWLLFVVYCCLLFVVVCCLLFVVCWWMIGGHCSLCVAGRAFCVACCWNVVCRCVLPVVHCLLFAACWPLIGVCGLSLLAVCCLLIVCS